MEAYKFETKVSEKGIIKLPFEPALFNKEVELIVLPKTKNKRIRDTAKPVSFITKWAGAFQPMTDDEINEAKAEYLNRKHQ